MKHFFTFTLCLLIIMAGKAQNSSVMKQVVVAEYRTWYITQDGKIWAYSNNSALPVQFPIGGLKADTGAGGFNYFRILDEQGYVWTNTDAYATTTARIDTDTTGAPFGSNWYIDAYGHAALTIRADSSVWFFGKDIYSLFYPGGSPISMTGAAMKPTRMSPAGMKFRKVLFGGITILGLTTTGQVYQWSVGSRTPTLIPTPRPASDIFISHLNAAGCIIPDAGGNPSMGYPYIWGGTGSMWGGTNSTTPVSVKALWKMTAPIREISMDWNTIHYIDSLGNMYGCGFNSFGEVGNGQEFINKYNYPGFPGYGWDLVDYENPSGIPVQIGKGIRWKHIYSNNWFGFYKYAMDVNDSIYSWGRNKSLALGNGLWNGYNGGQYHPNTLDVLKPTMVHPLTAIFTEYGFIPPSISVGPKQVISTSAATLKGVAQAPLCVAVKKPAPNGIDTAGYKIVSYQWTKVSGPASGTITSPNAATTTVTNLSAGTYIFNLLTTDNNTGTLSANDTVQVTVNASSGSTGSAYQSVPSTIQGESYATMSGVATETTQDAGGGLDVGWISKGDWMSFNLNVVSAGTYTVSFRVSSALTGASFKMQDAKGNILTTVNVPNTGGWQAWTAVTASVTLPAGTQTLTIISLADNGWNLNWMQFALQVTVPSGKAIPGTIQAENYDAMIGVGTETTKDAGGGLDVNYLNYPGNQVSYNVTVSAAATYTATFRVSSPVTGATFKVMDGKNNVLATVTVPNTGGWQIWSNVSASVSLPAGAQTVKIVCQTTSGFNFNWMQFVQSTTVAIAGIATSGSAISGISAGPADSTATSQPAHFNLYPNPATDQVTLDIADNYAGRLDVQIISVAGMVVRRYELNKGLVIIQTPISLSGLTPGIYVIRVSGAGWYVTKKILKQ
ncbi:MAG TPA: carbohydrate-binding protein [Puia sp.]